MNKTLEQRADHYSWEQWHRHGMPAIMVPRTNDAWLAGYRAAQRDQHGHICPAKQKDRRGCAAVSAKTPAQRKADERARMRAAECPCVRSIFEQDCAFPGCYGGELMARAPKDGTEIEILFRHADFFYANPEDRHQWQQWCRAYWTEFNGGGWVWRGICGEPLCWRHVTPNV